MYTIIDLETKTEYEHNDNLPYMAVRLMTLRYRFFCASLSMLDSDGFVVSSKDIENALYSASTTLFCK